MDNSACYEKIKSAVRAADHPQPPDPDLFQPTSVMALFMFDSDPSLLFIQKADRAGYPWANQMAFPGGHVDEMDENPRATALRELNEEMGIASDNVRVMGSLGHFQTLNNKDIQAFAGVWNQKDDIRFDTYEIQRVFKIPFAHLAGVHREKGYAGRRPNIMELTYPYEDVIIWGVTAKIVHHLIEVVYTT
ncbi:MAG TPA: CoA pyrophosphatase [Desulfobacteraceae bacterium]|nr:CoA pyrophosphatase [Desulfobacteraceae bacterium]|tara:strand:- start:456 stop:1025 length:570 start_codon:yes stop_codon:yes gene_type:complete